MSLRTSSRRHSQRRHSGAKGGFPAGLGILFTTAVLAVILMTGPAVLGSDRLWIDLPLSAGIALLLLIQGLRLTLNKPAENGRRLDLIDWSVLLFTGYTAVLWLTSPAEYLSRIELIDVIGYAGIFLTCRYGMGNRRFAIFLLYLLVILGLGEAIFGYYLDKHLDWFPFGPTETNQLHYAPRWIGTYGFPNGYGCLLVMAISAALAMVGFSRLQWPVRIIIFYVALMMMVAVGYSASRGSWIALAVAVIALVAWGLRHGTMRWWIPVLAAFVLFGLAIALFSVTSIARQRTSELVALFTGGNLETYVRVELARDALHIAHDHPAFGTGPGSFKYVHPRYQDATFAFQAELTHDDYLNCLDDYGIVGFGLAMLFVAAVTLKFFRPLDLDTRWQDRVVVATGFAAWLALLAHSFVDFNMHIPANARLLFALTGLALARFKQEDALIKNWSTLSLARLGPWPGVALCLASLAFGIYAIKYAESDILYEETSARADVIPTAESIADTKKALAYDPTNGYALKFLGDLHRYRASRQSDMPGRIAEGQLAIDAYQKAFAANPYDDTITARMGRTYDVMRRFPEAYFCYSTAITNQPYNGEFWFRLGNHYWVRGMLAKAEEAFLISAHCPHGATGAREAEDQLRQLPEMEGVPPPAPGANPLITAPEGPSQTLP
ncbi:MAG TPA: O-antigen ligase family protein [Candidatus Methylacidiphilales bacterium]|jgi:O-antigen ligase|nr:O-antigen ligase family protein [Candidatus Methylacidiphilales bacterium]